MKDLFYNHRTMLRFVTLFLSIVFTFSPLILSYEEKHIDKRISSLGEYSGFSEPLYDSYQRFSQYITVRDGTKLAVDILRPTRNGNLVVKQLPVIWTHNRYHRADKVNGEVILNISQEILPLLRYGYIIGNVDMRGSGASFGVYNGPLFPTEAQDGYDVTEWFARQPWCNGKIGMWGASYPGIAEYMVAGQMPPHLKAIIPEMALFDLYSFTYPNGIFRNNFMQNWNTIINTLDCIYPAAGVDGDDSGLLLNAAIKEHQKNIDVNRLINSLPFRDSIYGEFENHFYQITSPNNYLDQIQRSGIGVYHIGGWYDSFTKDTVLFYNNLKNNQKLLIGPWPHQLKLGFDWTAEYHRWFDYWLKGIDNGIEKEPSIYYYTMSPTKGKGGWRTTPVWPLPDQVMTKFYFHNGNFRTISPENDCNLSKDPPSINYGFDQYQINYTTSTGKTSRWSNGSGGVFACPDLSENDSLGLSYTSAPLRTDMEITGHPIVHLWITSTAYDGDFFVYLEDVGEKDNSTYITEGVLRASHRSLSPAPYNNLDLPYHRGNTHDLIKLPSVPVELTFDLIPSSYIFEVGHKIRITITGADCDNYETPNLTPLPIIKVFHNKQFASYIDLPVIPANRTKQYQTNINNSRMESYLHDNLGQVQICGAIWNGEPDQTLSIEVKKLPDQDYRHLLDFYNSTDKKFTLKAPDQPDVIAFVNGAITTYGLGSFQGYGLKISPNELEKMVRGIKYKLYPENKTKNYQWIVIDGVTITRL